MSDVPEFCVVHSLRVEVAFRRSCNLRVGVLTKTITFRMCAQHDAIRPTLADAVVHLLHSVVARDVFPAS